jgi:hypothetical protein
MQLLASIRRAAPGSSGWGNMARRYRDKLKESRRLNKQEYIKKMRSSSKEMYL